VPLVFSAARLIAGKCIRQHFHLYYHLYLYLQSFFLVQGAECLFIQLELCLLVFHLHSAGRCRRPGHRPLAHVLHGSLGQFNSVAQQTPSHVHVSKWQSTVHLPGRKMIHGNIDCETRTLIRVLI